MKTKMGAIKMLQPIDCIKDRLASFYHWDDRQGLEQALDVCREIQTIDFEELKRWSKGEGFLEKYQDFLNHLFGYSLGIGESKCASLVGDLWIGAPLEFCRLRKTLSFITQKKKSFCSVKKGWLMSGIKSECFFKKV